MAQYGIGQRRLGSGIMMPGISGEVIPRGAAVYMSAVDGLWYLADSDAAATLPTVGISAERASVAGRNFNIVLVGIMGRGDWAWTRGDTIYTSGVAGVLTQVAPANAQPLAVALTATLIYVNPALAVVGGGGVAGDPSDQFFAAPDPDGYIGPYASMSMPDGADTVVRQTFRLPNNWTASWGVSLVVIPAASGNLRRTITTNFCAAGEVYNTHTDTIAAGVQAVTLNEQELIDITAALTGAAAGDLVGIEYLRDALTSAADTVAATVHYIGVLLTEA